MRQRNFKKHFKFHNFGEILNCGMNRLRKTNLSVVMQYQHTRTNLRNKSLGQSLVKKHSKFQKVDKILYCGMTRFKNVKLGVFRQYQNTDTKKEKYRTGSF